MGNGSSLRSLGVSVSPDDSGPWDHIWVYVNEVTHRGPLGQFRKEAGRAQKINRVTRVGALNPEVSTQVEVKQVASDSVNHDCTVNPQEKLWTQRLR